MKAFTPIAAAALAVAATAPAHAATVFGASFSGGQVVPATPSTAFGTGLLSVSNTLDMLDVSVLFLGLTGNATGAALHCCAPAGSNGLGAINLSGFPTASFGGYLHSFNLTQASTYTNAFRTANGGTALTARAALLSGLSNGLGYLQIRSTAFPRGELRAQAFALSAVPEPKVWFSLLTGMMLTAVMLRWRRRDRRQVHYVLA